MRRREFISLAVGTAVTWPLVARAQQPEMMRRIGVLSSLAETDSEAQVWDAAFRKRLAELGWIDGRSVHIDSRWAAGSVDRMRLFARELVQLNPDALVTISTPATAAVQAETRTIPIVFAWVSDPVGSGFVSSLAHPGGNITGFLNIETSVVGKWLTLMREIAPQVSRIGFLYNPQTAPYARYYLDTFNDARGIAQMMRVGLYRPVHVKTLRSQKLRMLLTHRKLLQAKAIAVENDLRATLRNFGLKVGMVGTIKFEARVKDLVDNFPDLATLVQPLLVVRRVLREQISILHRRVLAVVRDDEVCRRLMTVPGVGPIVALTYRATIDVPARFRKSKSVGAVFGLTPARDQSGERDRPGAISRCGDEMMRTTLYEAAQVMLLRSAKWSWLKAWAMKIARHRGMKKAIVALARRLAVIMHRIWTDGTEFRWTREAAV